MRSALGESGRQQLLSCATPWCPQGRLLQCSWQPIRADEGISGGLVVFTDVTELQRLQAEQAAQFEELRETQRKLIESQRVGRVGNWELDLAAAGCGGPTRCMACSAWRREEFDSTLAALPAGSIPRTGACSSRPAMRPCATAR